MRPGINAADIVTAAERLRHEGRSISTVAVREKLCLCYRTRTFRALPAADAKTFHDNRELAATSSHSSVTLLPRPGVTVPQPRAARL